MVTVEKYHSALHFRWKKAKKSVNFICCRPQGKVPLLKEWWRASSEHLWDPCQPACSNRAKCWSLTLEIEGVKWKGRFEILGDRKFPHSQKNPSFGKDLPRNHQEVWNREGCNLVAVVPTTVHRREE